jgi:predicted nucleotidyltransferase
MIDRMIDDKIKHLLQTVESVEDVSILYAVESGSRAWGFPSADSDYDVRFVYIHRRDWYLSIDLENRRDVIERPIEDLIDLSGWDIRKAFRLFAKANPPHIEWLTSPIVYRDASDFGAQLRELLPIYYEPRVCMYHYLHMADNNRREYLGGSTVWLKKYLYVLRPVLAARWIEQNRGPVPMAFKELLVTIGEQQQLVQAIIELIQRKQNGDELDRGPGIPIISNFITQEMERQQIIRTKEGKTQDLGRLQSLFLLRLSESWPATT